MVYTIGIGVFVFVTLVVGGLRILKALEIHEGQKAAMARRRNAKTIGREYTGARYNVHGREIS